MKVYKFHSTTNPYLTEVRKHKKPYIAKILGKEIIVYPNVHSPKYDWSTRFYIQNIPNQRGKTFLEIGCGSGAISLFACFQGTKRVVCVDINRNAIKNTLVNFKKYMVTNAETFLSDVFENVKGKFDTILFNAPYHSTKPKDILECAVTDYRYKVLRKFMKDAKNFLNKNGQVLLGFSDTGDVGLVEELIKKYGYLLKGFYEEENHGWRAYLYVLEV